MKTYKYSYQRFPFDSDQYFTIEANNPTEADQLAKEKFTKMFEERTTIMIKFYRVDF